MLPLVCALATANAGCIVGQPPGNGQVMFLHEPTTDAGYWLYLPEDYVAQPDKMLTGKKWPVVVTFHGMKPFDDDHSQIQQWQQEADRYGFVVVAPQLCTPDLLYEFPFRHITDELKRDEVNTIAILEHLTTVADIDPNAVLSTSWSSGGYLAHYMANTHPDWFSCVAVYQSNFAEAIMDPARVPEYRDHKIAIFFTENDFDVCQEESKRGAQWYARQGFDLTFAKFRSLGHERTPSVAASFFAKTCGATAKTPPTELVRLQVREVPLDAEEATSLTVADTRNARRQPIPVDRSANSASQSRDGKGDSRNRTVKPSNGTRPTPSDRNRATRPAPREAKPLETRPTQAPLTRERTPERTTTATPPPVQVPHVRLRLSSTIGIAPLLVSYSAVVPGSKRRGAYFLWTDNGEAIANGINGQTYLTRPGDHKIEVTMTTADGKQYRASQTVTVLERITREPN